MNSPDISGTLFEILHATAYWTSGIFHTWKEGRGRRAFENCSIKAIDGKFPSKADAIIAAEKAMKEQGLSGVNWGTARPVASFYIPHETAKKIGALMDSFVARRRNSDEANRGHDYSNL